MLDVKSMFVLDELSLQFVPGVSHLCALAIKSAKESAYSQQIAWNIMAVALQSLLLITYFVVLLMSATGTKLNLGSIPCQVTQHFP